MILFVMTKTTQAKKKNNFHLFQKRVKRLKAKTTIVY